MSQDTINHNAAGRLFLFLRQLRNALAPASIPVANSWRHAAGLPSSDLKSDNLETASALAAATRITIQSLAAQLAARDVPDQLYAPFVVRLIGVTDISLHHQPHHVSIQHLDGESMLALQWWAFVLPEDGASVSDADIEELQVRLSELEEAVNQPGIPAELRRFALDHLQTLRNALMLYPLQGVSTIKAAVRAAVSDVHFHEEELKAATGNPAPETTHLLSKIEGTLEKASKVSGYAEKTAKALGYLTDKAVSFGEGVADAINALK